MTSIRQIPRLNSIACPEDNSFRYRVTYLDDDAVTPIDLSVAGVRAIFRVEEPDGTVYATVSTATSGTTWGTDGTDGVVNFYLTAVQIAAMNAGMIYRGFIRIEDDNQVPAEARDIAWVPLLIKKG